MSDEAVADHEAEQPMSARCPVCGEPLPEGARFCPHCGAPVHAPLADDVTGTLPIERVDQPLLEMPATTSGGTPVLLLRSGPQAGSWYALTTEVTTIGRHPDSDVFLNDVTVSRRHAEIRREDGHYVLYDAGSLNGTYVDHVRQERAELHHGSEIQIGRFRFTFFVPETA